MRKLRTFTREEKKREKEKKERDVSEKSVIFKEREGESVAREDCHLGVEWVLSVASNCIGDALLRHQPGLVHVVAVDLLRVAL